MKKLFKNQTIDNRFVLSFETRVASLLVSQSVSQLVSQASFLLTNAILIDHAVMMRSN